MTLTYLADVNTIGVFLQLHIEPALLTTATQLHLVGHELCVELRDELSVLGSDGDVVVRRHTRLKRGIRGSQISRAIAGATFDGRPRDRAPRGGKSGDEETS